jgi:hypothetical protein
MGATYSRLVFYPPTPPSYSTDSLDDICWAPLVPNDIKDSEQIPKLNRSQDLDEKSTHETTNMIPFLHYKFQGNNGEKSFIKFPFLKFLGQNIRYCIPMGTQRILDR